MVIGNVAKRCFTNGFLALLEGPECQFRSPLGPQPVARSGIPGPRMDEIVYSGIMDLFFVRTKKGPIYGAGTIMLTQFN